MTTYTVLMAAPAVGLLCCAALIDVRSRRIPNWVTFSLVLSGLAQSVAFNGAVSTPGQAILGLCAGFALPFAMFAIGALGGGDVKLLAGIGAWFGASAVLQVFCLEAAVGMTMVLAQAASQGRLNALFRNSAVLAVNLAHVSDVGVDHVRATGQASKSIDRPLPYAVPVLIAVLILLAWNWTPGSM
ncbi:MAG TPA: A24 family peptidase [Tepidisphaeraceae bacterium]|nr:A24 family peptidase [Tepidisphaeraceae bacterium]